MTVEQALAHPFFDEVRTDAAPTPKAHPGLRAALNDALLRTMNHADSPFAMELYFEYMWLKLQARLCVDDAAAADASST